MLNSVSKAKIVQLLDGTPLTSGNFLIQSVWGLQLLHLRCKLNEKYFLIAEDAALSFGPTTFDVKMSPGEIGVEEFYRAGTFDEILALVAKWATNIGAEFEAQQTLRRRSELSSAIEAYIVERYPDPSTSLTNVDFDALFEKLNDLEKELDELRSESKEQREELKKLRVQIDELRQAAITLPAQVFLRRFGTWMGYFVTFAAGNPHVQEKIWTLIQSLKTMIGA